MAAQLATLLCILAAALIHLPDAQSRTTQPTRYDAARELSEKFDEKYYLVQRSHYTDRKMGDSASCVSVLKLSPLHGQSGITVQVSIKANSYRDPVTNKEWKMVAYTPAGSGTKYMIKTTDLVTAELLYNQELAFSDHISCRVLVHIADGDNHCQLWVNYRAVTGSVPRGCQQAYDKYCQTKHTIFRRECLQ
uniref:Histamine binding protein n=1 Tax=Ixodes scapularis TaxID=6945 RepID=Q4PMW6_IXOSC|nr:histamine binding protein [Ixodes scapularis]